MSSTGAPSSSQSYFSIPFTCSHIHFCTAIGAIIPIGICVIFTIILFAACHSFTITTVGTYPHIPCFSGNSPPAICCTSIAPRWFRQRHPVGDGSVKHKRTCALKEMPNTYHTLPALASANNKIVPVFFRQSILHTDPLTHFLLPPASCGRPASRFHRPHSA